MGASAPFVLQDPHRTRQDARLYSCAASLRMALWITYLLLAIGEWSHVTLVTRIRGYTGIITALVAFLGLGRGGDQRCVWTLGIAGWPARPRVA